MEKVRPRCGQPSDRGRLKNKQIGSNASFERHCRLIRLVTISTLRLIKQKSHFGSDEPTVHAV